MATRKKDRTRQTTPLRDHRVVIPVLIGLSASGLTAWLEAPALQISVIGVIASLALGVSLASREVPKPTGSLLDLPFLLSRDREAFDCYQNIARALLRFSQKTDPIFRDAALERLVRVERDVNEIANGTLVYTSTEVWRLVYEKLLRSNGLYQYRSVAYVRSPDYWQDAPGRQSTQLNIEIAGAGRTQINRLLILSDDVWPPDQRLPRESIAAWIHYQHQHGIEMRLVRESQLDAVPELIADFGIYGSRAVGTQELDAACRTSRFVLTFDFERVQQAEKHWENLSVYSGLYKHLLDQA